MPFRMVLPETLWGLAHLFRSAGHQFYVVGGAVRDAVMGSNPKDYDVATDATPDQVLDLLSRVRSWKTNEVGRSFGVVRARCYDHDGSPISDEYEIATFRRDIGTGRRPVGVVFTSIEEDVMRRDFTVNALFYDVDSLEVVDLVGGLADIQRGVVRTVGRPEDRFAEDRLRIMRAIRFASRLGYAIDDDTARAIRDDGSLSGVSFERIHDEFVRSIASARDVSALMQTMDELGMWPRVLPGLKASTRLDSLVSTRGIDTNDPTLVLALLLDGEDVASLGGRLAHLRYNNEEVAQVTSFLALRDLGPDGAYVLRRAVNQGRLARERLSQYFIRRGMPGRRTFDAFMRYLDAPPVDGDTLMAQGYSGKELGVELRRRERELFVSMEA